MGTPYATARPSRVGRTLAVVAAVLVVLVGVVVAIGRLTRPTSYDIAFSTSGSGWPTRTLASGTTLSRIGGAYVIAGQGNLHHYALAPTRLRSNSLRVEVVATQPTTEAPAGSGFGVVCTRGSGDGRVQYELLLLDPEHWFIERRTGPDGASTTKVIEDGTAVRGPSAVVATVAGTCVTSGSVTHLQIFLDDNLIGSADDPAPSLDGSGWQGGLITASRASAPTTVWIREFHERKAS